MKPFLVLLFLGFEIFFNSCSSDVLLKKEIFDKVEIGMTVKQVKDILGEPVETKPGIDSTISYFYYIHNNPVRKDYAVVQFNKDGFVYFKFYGNPS